MDAPVYLTINAYLGWPIVLNPFFLYSSIKCFYAMCCCFTLLEAIMAKRHRKKAFKTSRKNRKVKIKKGRRKSKKYRKLAPFSSRFPHRSIFKSKHLR